MIVETGDQWSAILLPLLILVGIGILGIVGWLVWIFTRGSRSKAKTVDVAASTAPPAGSGFQERAAHERAAHVRGGNESAGSEPVGIGPAGSGTPAAAPSVADSAALTYFLGLRRSAATGEWEIHVQGQPYDALGSVPSQPIQAQVVSALRALVEFSRDYMQAQKSAPQSSPPSSPRPAARPQADRTGRPAPSSPSVPGQGREATWRGRSQAAMMPTIDLAQEIGDIVEEMLAKEPTLEGHAVRLMNSPTGGVTFVVDGVIYHGLDEIPHAEIQTLIRRATREWERR